MKKLTLLTAVIMLLSPSVFAYQNPVYVVPSGKSAGIRLYTDGLNVIGTQDIISSDGKSVNPALNNGIKTGDIIFSADGSPLNTVDELSKAVNSCTGSIKLEVKRGAQELTINAEPVKAEDNTNKLGLWIRDSTAGIGTVTYYLPENNSYAALGHGICDTDTGNILSVKSGNIQQCSSLSVKKSERGKPGEIEGSFTEPNIGFLDVNSDTGLYGEIIKNDFFEGVSIKAASRYDVHEGGAYIMSDVAGNGVECYSIEIQKVKSESTDTKGIVFKVTDERLISVSGGIVRGMSGAPIIQNGEFVGAVTHVFVNDPSKGYGIIGENMINNSFKYLQ